MSVASFALLLALVCAPIAFAQAASHFLGTITTINGNALTIKTAQGDEQVEVPANADLKRVEPGQTSLSAAVAMQFSELAVGDRVLVWIDPNSPAGSPQATRLVAIKAADLAKKHEQEAAEWQQNGVAGLVKSVDPGAGTIVITSGAGPAMHVITIHTTQSTVLKRYAPASVNYAEAKPAPITSIHSGDELRARGTKNEDGKEMAADEIVSGSFRNISGVIASLDAAHSTFTLKDLATKKMVTVQVPQDAQMRELPERMAQFLAARLKGGAGARGGNGGESGAAGAGGGSHEHSEMSQHGGGGAMDSQQVLSRAPEIHFADLKKGDAVMLVATPGDSQATAITLIAGVEPLLEAPASQDLLANWSMGSGGGAEAAGGGQQ
jgi:Domain of unknown function (DUF5666)